MTTAFSSLGIKANTSGFSGEHIKLKKLFDEPIIIHAFRLRTSNIRKDRKGNEIEPKQLLHLDITYQERSHITWTTSTNLLEMIQQVPPDKFPISTVIKEENDRYFFT